MLCFAIALSLHCYNPIHIYVQEFLAKKAKYQVPTNMKKDAAEAFKSVDKVLAQLGKIIVEQSASPAHVKGVLSKGVAEYKVCLALVGKIAALSKE
jgi:hypothetical protein